MIATMLASMFVIIALLLALSSAQNTLPTISTEYATTVEFSFSNNGYSLSYDESYSASNNIALTTGRYVDRTTLELSTFSSSSSGTLNSIDKATSPVTCTSYTLGSAQLSSLLYTPISAFYSLISSPNIPYPYVNRTTLVDRDVVADQYKASGVTINTIGQYCIAGTCYTPANGFTFSELIDFNYGQVNTPLSAVVDINVYISTIPASWIGNQNQRIISSYAAPLRVTVNGTFTNSAGSATSFVNTFDFVNWHRVDTSVFSVFSAITCPSGTTPFRVQFPTNNTVAAPTIPLNSAPNGFSFPQEMTMVLEAPQNGQAGGANGLNNGTFYNNIAGVWNLDVLGNREAVSYYNTNNTNNIVTLNTYPTTTVYLYNSSLPGGGIRYSLNGPATAPTCNQPQTLANVVASSVGQGVSGIGGTAFGNSINNRTAAGTLSLMFANTNYDTSAFQYQGQTMWRSVKADWYRAFNQISTETVSNNGPGFSGIIVNQFTQDVYLFPNGWQFLGRNNAADYQLPLAIVNNGTATQSGTWARMCNQFNCNRTAYTNTVAYTDIFAIFELLPYQSSASFPFPVYSSPYNCVPYVAPTPPSNLVSLPYVAPSYTTTVEMNFGTLGYTLSYDEYYSQSLGILRADARYQSRSTIEITYAASQLDVSTMLAIDTDASTCTFYQLQADQATSLLFLPSYSILQLLNFTGFQWTTTQFPTVLPDRNMFVNVYTESYVNISSTGQSCDPYGNCQQLPSTTNGNQFHELIDFSTYFESDSYYAVFSMTMYYLWVNTGFNPQPTARIPVRLFINGTRYSADNSTAPPLPFNNTYDWTFWHGLDTTVFNVVQTYNCPTSAGSSDTSFDRQANLFPTVSTVSSTLPSYTSYPSASSFPDELSMVLETLQLSNSIAGNNQIAGTLIQQATGVHWEYSASRNAEIISQFPTANNPVNQVYPQSYVYLYSNPTTTYLNGGIYFNVTTGNAPAYNTICTLGTINNTAVQNVVDGLGGARIPVTGSIKALFLNGNYDYSVFQYMGRRTIRSVTADVYTTKTPFQVYTPPYVYNTAPAFANFTQDILSTFTQTIYLFPVGWQYPGRNTASDVQLPLYVVNAGTAFVTVYNNGKANNITRLSSWNDTWSIFELIPEKTSTTYGALSTAIASCPSVPSAYVTATNNPSSSSSNTGLIVGLVIGLVCGIPILLIIFYFLFRATFTQEKTAKSTTNTDNVKMQTSTTKSDEVELDETQV